MVKKYLQKVHVKYALLLMNVGNFINKFKIRNLKIPSILKEATCGMYKIVMSRKLYYYGGLCKPHRKVETPL